MTAIPATLRLRREGILRSRAARGDSAAFAAVYERHHQALYRYCRSILRHEEDAQDALQSTMAKAFAALQDERRDFDLKPWLFRIAHNEAISILRRRRETAELGDVEDTAPMEDLVLEREELRALQMDLADLPDRQRAALVLRELNGLSHAEIATVLELTPTAVKHTIFEARSALFLCREGREMGCHDVRRMLSDGDGRVLRGRGVRAHLRTCRDCRAFRDDLTQRPVALKLLAPPLPPAAAASLFASLLGGGTAAKVICCVALAGGGATLAVEVQQARQAPRAAAAEKLPAAAGVKRVAVTPTATPPRAVPPPVVAAAAAQDEPRRAATPEKKQKVRKVVSKAKPHAKAKAEPPASSKVVAPPVARQVKQAAKLQRNAVKVQAKVKIKVKAPKPLKVKAPKPARPPKAVPPGNAKHDQPQPPGQAKKNR